ncbi:serine/threonine protein kinase [Stieleria varia]|uniref:Serine/threonine-protein kinase PrkC n=1 Tax=Stieleria varia TaxID=2528005 RepID=A0A5C5ZK54_9BACT|nr:serine/threonine-protein kinase [Stieleria varia]TWT87752.1 Serine/threonine-protein kinase PrkC [Stieleria varia]
MPFDDSINADGSTVHRPTDSQLLASQAGPVTEGSSQLRAANGGSSANTGNVINEIADAKTVIRAPAALSPPAERSGRTPSDVAKILVGQQLNQYRLEEMIGGGGMGAVFRGHDEQLDRTVAIKVIPFVGNDPEMQRRFRNEAQNAAKLDHPRIARVFDAGSHDDWHYIVFEYIRGTNLRDLTNSIGVLNLDDAVYYTCQLAEALQHAADRGIVHRDIKPSNVLIGDSDTIKLVDMGLARSDNLDLSEDMTASGVTLGTFDYISPEQALDPRDADLRSDIYSLGCTLYFMLTGEPPYTGGTMLQKLLSHGNAPLPDPRELRADLPDDIVAVMQRMMAKEPKNRYQNANDLIADLMEVSYRHQLKRSLLLGPSTPPAPINAGMIWFQNHAPWIIAITLVLIVAGWLELSSAASRGEFVISRPEIQAELPPGPVNSDMVESVSAEPSLSTDGDSAQAIKSVGSNVNSTRPADAAAVESPSSVEFPVPSALSNPANATTPFDPQAGANPLGSSNAMAGAEMTVSPGIPAEITADTLGVQDDPRTDLLINAAELIRVVEPGSNLPRAMPDSLYLSDSDGAALVTSLEEAVMLAEQLEINQIEITAKRLVSGPIAITRDGLTITSVAPGGTEVEMQWQESLEVERAELIVIGSNRVTLSGIHFEWELPAEQVNGGSLFVLNENRLVRLQDSSVTIVNRRKHENVFVLSVLTGNSEPNRPVSAPTTTASTTNALPLVGIRLDNVIVRGETNMMEMNHAAALQLVWDNGLLAITGRLLDTGGARFLPPRSDGPMQLKLSGLTAETQAGFARMKLSSSGPFPVAIVREAIDCVFVVSAGNPHFEFLGLDSLSSETSLLTLRGQANSYSASSQLNDPMLRIKDTDEDTEEVSLEELANSPPSWFDERSTLWSVWWSSDDVKDQQKTVSKATPSDYRQDGPMVGGFDEQLLPKIPGAATETDEESPVYGPLELQR